MLLEKVRLVNVCQHADLTAEFGTGITAIVGPNGSGKSNLADMIRVSITADFAGLRGTKDMNIRRGISDDDVSYTQTWWNTNNGYLSVRRGFQGVPSALFLNNVEDRTITGKEQAITKRALALLGVSAGTINDFMFADFTTLRRIVEGTKSARMEMFTSLCGIDNVLRVLAVVNKQLTADNAVIAEVSPTREIDDLKVRWHAIRSRLRELREAYVKADELSVPAEVISDLQRKKDELLNAETQLVDIRKSIDGKSSTATNHRTNILRLTSEVDETTASIARVRLDKLKPAEDLYAEMALAQKEYLSRKEKFQALENARITLLDKTPQPPTPPDKIDCDGLATEESRLSAAITAAADYRESLGEGGDIVCTECGKVKGKVTAESIAEADAALTALLKTKTEVSKSLALARTYRKAVNEYGVKKAVWDQQQKAATETASRLENDPEAQESPREVDAATVLKCKADLDTCKREVEDLEEELPKKKNALRDEENKLLVAETNLATLRQTRDDLLAKYGRKPAEGVPAIDEELNNHKQHQALVDGLRTQLHVHEARGREVLPTLRRHYAKRRRVRRLIKFVDVANRFKVMAGRDRLQARAIGQTLQKTTHYVNVFLTQFSMPFRVTIDPEEFEFIVHHRDGTKESAVRLSVGQGLALGISFWLARTTAFHGELPLFVLDEPTANLDSERVVSVANLFSRLGNELQDAGRQGIVITHHMAVADSSTRKVVLGQ